MAINLGGLGAFLGGNQGQGGAIAPIAAALQKQRAQQQQTQALTMLRAAIAGQQGGGAGFQPYPPQGMPAGAPPQAPSAAPMTPQTPGGIQSMVPPTPGAGMTPQPGGAPGTMTPLATRQQPPAQPPNASLQGPDILAKQQQMMLKILDTPGPAASKVEALNMIGAYLSPVEKLQLTFESNMAKLQNQRDMFGQKLQELIDLQMLRGQQSGSNTDKRIEAGQEKETLADMEKNVSDTRSFAQSLVAANKIDSPDYKDAMKAYQEAVKAKQDYLAGKKSGAPASKPSTAKVAPAAGSAPAGGVPLPKEMQDKPDGTTVPDETGKVWIKQGNQLVPQG